MEWQIRYLPKSKWPKSLLEIPKRDLPKQLRIIGPEPNWSLKRICIVGSRNYSDYGEKVCHKIIEGLRDYPVAIVSGLAYGIDSISHRIALENKIPIIAIPGSGLIHDVIYPKRHVGLVEKILTKDGCLISEFDDEQPATRWTFPQRNRIIAAISDLVLIIEANEKSGTMITARLSLDYNIDVAVIPGSIFSSTSLGTNKLLREGAIPVTCTEDILEILNIKPKIKQQNIFKNNLSSEEINILRFLKIPKNKEQLLKKTSLKISDLNKILSTLEIEGLIHKIGDKICQK